MTIFQLAAAPLAIREADKSMRERFFKPNLVCILTVRIIIRPLLTLHPTN